MLFISAAGYSGFDIKLNPRVVGTLFSIVVCCLFFLLVLAERQRTPFDFAEGERELVSGFNTEFPSSYFALVFLGENGIFILMSGVLAGVCLL